MRQVLRKREVYPILIIILERIRQKVAAKSRLKEQMARFARFFKAARFNLIFKRIVLKWRDKTLIPRPINSTTEELTKWMDDRAKQHLKWLHGPSDDDDNDDEEGAFTIITSTGDVPWKIGDVPSIAGGRSKSFPASLVGRRTSIPCGGSKCQMHNSSSCVRCYHAGVLKISSLCKCGQMWPTKLDLLPVHPRSATDYQG